MTIYAFQSTLMLVVLVVLLAVKGFAFINSLTYSAEAYDATNVLLQGILEGSGDRESLLEWVNNYNAAGITKQIQFDETGEVSTVVIYAYPVEGGAIVPGEAIE